MIIWAHRGASGEYPENTLLAFEQAIIQGADGIELDVFQVQNELYIWHNRHFPSLSGEQTLIWQQSGLEIERLELAAEQKVPTLSQALQKIAGRVKVNVEIKRIDTIGLLLNTLNSAITHHDFTPQQLLISSFDHEVLLALRQQQVAFPIGVLVASSLTLMQSALTRLKPFSIHFDCNCLTPQSLRFCEAQGFRSYVYTVDAVSDLLWLAEEGVDGVFTNYPARTRALLSSSK